MRPRRTVMALISALAITTTAARADDDANATHWSLRPLARPPVPCAEGEGAASPIDLFVRRELERAGVRRSPPEEPATLVRRLFLDVLGMLPSPREVDAFIADDSPRAWSDLVDRVLASPRRGERWARHWLDVVRFAESHGFETNRERANAYHYRDWVIDALNGDMPFDRFVTAQLAGDVIGEDAATGFLVAGPNDIVKSPDIVLTLTQRQDELADIIGATGTAFLGLTLGCARCHDHKFDPVSQRDFYALQAVFAGVQHGERAARRRLDADDVALVNRLERRLAEVSTRLRPLGVLEPVRSERNDEWIAPVTARYVRLRVEATSGGEPCIDELELYTDAEAEAPSRNVALASAGARATSSSDLTGHDIHKLAHVNDGLYGNARSWIAGTTTDAWVELELPRPERIRRIVWGRDREGMYRDRTPTRYTIETALTRGEWREAARDTHRARSDGPGRAAASRAEPGAALLAERDALRERLAELTGEHMQYAGTFEQPGPTHLLHRGDPLLKREVVSPGGLSALATLEFEPGAAERDVRLGLAQWIASGTNPLTARVIANRVWQHHFGEGLVTTPDDFGANGAAPTHPELLDWLACELIDGGWSLARLHRLIICSETYRQSSRPRPEALAVDAMTRLLWRFPPRRLAAEPIRDCMLQASGSLDLSMGGPGFSVFRVARENVYHYAPDDCLDPSTWRRAIYMRKIRQEQDGIFGVFDCPDGNSAAPRRSRSTTPLQALNLLNSAFVGEQARRFVARLEREGGALLEGRIERAFRILFGRRPDAVELEASRDLAREHGLAALCRALFNSNELLFLQ